MQTPRTHKTNWQVNKAIDMLMDKLDHDDFAASVFTKETALHSRHRKAVGEDEKREIVTKGMFHYFDNDHSNEIDALEFAEGIRMMAQDAKRFAEVPCVGGWVGGWAVGECALL